MVDEPFAGLISVRARAEPHSPVNFWLLIILTLCLLALAVGYFGGRGVPDEEPLVASQSATAAYPSRTYTVTYRFGVFSPTNLRIRVGDTVTFRNDDGDDIRITAAPQTPSGRPAFDSVGQVPPGSSFSYTFIAEGVFAYHNAADDRQAGVIIVRTP